MTAQTDKRPLRPSPRARWTYVALSVGAVTFAVLLTAVPLFITTTKGFDQLVALGLLQPLVAASMALAIVLGIRATAGRYVGERRKGGSSASGATIAVRLWALCFSLLAGAMLLFAAAARAPEWLQNTRGAGKPVNAQVEVNAAAGSTAAKIRIGR